MQIRDAIPEDAPAACIVLKRSIAELCEVDHRNDPSILARWLGNKTHENFCAWVRQIDNSVLVAVENQDILAVGSVTDAGTIGLNYVSPDARFRGVSRALLRALEIRAAERGNNRCNLTSTETARRFYLSNGYVENGPPVGGFGTSSGYPMTKALATPGPMECTIRPAGEEDVDELSAVILRALRETNAKDYAGEIIERIERSFSPSAVLELISKRTVFVAALGSRVVGTASLDGSLVRAVFVSPDVQTRGIGKLLMAEVEPRLARGKSVG
jgi:GNAT superfamily N-acetyltransferase